VNLDYSPISALRTAPPGLPSQLRKRLTRVGVSAAVAIFVVALVLAIALDLVPKTGPASVILMAHDHVYLPLRGVLWSAGFPWSLLVWVPVISLALAAWVDWVTGVSLLRELQTRFILFALGRPGGRTVLERWHLFVGGGRLRARYLEALVTAHTTLMRDAALQSAVDGPAPTPRGALIAHLCLSARLRTRYSDAIERTKVLAELMSVRALLTLGVVGQATDLGALDNAMTSILLQHDGAADDGRAAKGGVDLADTVSRLPMRATVLLANSDWAVSIARHALRRESVEAVGRMLAAAIRNQRMAVALLASRHEIRPSARADIDLEEDNEAASRAALSLSLAALALAAAVYPDEAGEEVRATLRELDRLHFAVAASQVGPDWREVFLTSAYAEVSRNGFGEELRALLEARVAPARQAAGLGFGEAAFGGERAGSVPETLGLSGERWSYFGAGARSDDR
jgi:hypothetical protein